MVNVMELYKHPIPEESSQLTLSKEGDQLTEDNAMVMNRPYEEA